MNSNNPLQFNSDNTPKKRPHQSSPSESDKISKEDKKHKADEMVLDISSRLDKIMASLDNMRESIDKNNTSLNSLGASITNLESKVVNIDQKLVSIKEELTITNKNVIVLKERLDLVEKQQTKHEIINQDVSASINTLMQLTKASEMSIHNLPPQFEKAYIISAFATWSGMNLNENTFKHSSLIQSKKASSSTLYLDFGIESQKLQFMKIIKSCQRDINKKYVPILTENIFELSTNDQSRGVELQFRNSMTNVNREIFNEARKYKSSFCAVWLNKGNVLVREKEETKPIRLMSMDDLKKAIEKTQHK